MCRAPHPAKEAQGVEWTVCPFVLDDELLARVPAGRVHASPLGAGEVRVTLADGSVVTANADGGFLSVEHDTVQVVASDAELVNG